MCTWQNETMWPKLLALNTLNFNIYLATKKLFHCIELTNSKSFFTLLNSHEFKIRTFIKIIVLINNKLPQNKVMELQNHDSQSPSSPRGNRITTTQRSIPVHDEITLEDNFSQENAPFPKKKQLLQSLIKKKQSLHPSNGHSIFYIKLEGFNRWFHHLGAIFIFHTELPLIFLLALPFLLISCAASHFCMVAFAVHRSFLFFSIIGRPEEIYSLDFIRC